MNAQLEQAVLQFLVRASRSDFDFDPRGDNESELALGERRSVNPGDPGPAIPRPKEPVDPGGRESRAPQRPRRGV